MKKKLKYVKMLISIILICSMIVPSYASLSASDGSFFVTKAEFDAALADFNSRLTMFEAGINSKIDSQVTSYLDRNGIWSAVEQAFTFGDDASVYGAVWNSTENQYVSPLYGATGAVGMHLGNAFLQGFNHTGTAYSTSTSYAWCWFLPMFKAKKSGLAFIHLFSENFYYYAQSSYTYIAISFTEDWVREPRPQNMTGNEYQDRKVVARIPIVVESSHCSTRNVYNWSQAGSIGTSGDKTVYALGSDYAYCDFMTQGFVKKGHNYYMTVGATRSDSIFTTGVGTQVGTGMTRGSKTYFTGAGGPTIGGTLKTELARRAECQIY